MLENKLGITSQAELNKQEEILSKKRAKELIESGKLFEFSVGTFQGLADIHYYLFQDLDEFAGQLRDVNIAKDDFQFAPRIFLEQSLDYIDRLPQSDFDEMIDKYADMNYVHPFLDGNGRATRLWLDSMLKKELGKIVDWNDIEKDEYLNAMKRSHVATSELKYLILNHLTDDLSRTSFFKGIDASYYYEGYNTYETEELENE